MSDNRLLDALTCRGVLASVSVRYWRARKKLSPSDLGLPDDRVNRRLISLPEPLVSASRSGIPLRPATALAGAPSRRQGQGGIMGVVPISV